MKTVQLSIWQLVLFGLLAGVCGAGFHDCSRTARASLGNDTSSISRSLSHIDLVLSEEFRIRYGREP